MAQCIASTELMVKTLEKRFEKFKTPESIVRGFGEPGTKDRMAGLPKVGVGTFRTQIPSIVFRHVTELSRIRKIRDRYAKVTELPEWGGALDLWRRVYEHE